MIICNRDCSMAHEAMYWLKEEAINTYLEIWEDENNHEYPRAEQFFERGLTIHDFLLGVEYRIFKECSSIDNKIKKQDIKERRKKLSEYIDETYGKDLWCKNFIIEDFFTIERLETPLDVRTYVLDALWEMRSKPQKVQCIETGEIFKSKHTAARRIGVKPTQLENHLKSSNKTGIGEGGYTYSYYNYSK